MRATGRMTQLAEMPVAEGSPCSSPSTGGTGWSDLEIPAKASSPSGYREDIIPRGPHQLCASTTPARNRQPVEVLRCVELGHCGGKVEEGEPLGVREDVELDDPPAPDRPAARRFIARSRASLPMIRPSRMRIADRPQPMRSGRWSRLTERRLTLTRLPGAPCRRQRGKIRPNPNQEGNRDDEAH
jgi:hypothetical protein